MKKTNILVHLHIYYQEQALFFLKRIKALSSCEQIDCIITYAVNHPCAGFIEAAVRQFLPDAHILKLPNIGYDIFPFVEALRAADNKYDYVLKLHTKSRSDKRKTLLNGVMLNDKAWSDLLADALIGSPSKFQRAISRLEDNNEIGMLGAEQCILKCEHRYVSGIFGEMRRLNVKEAQNLRYVAGTMFIARTDILTPLLSLSEEHFRNENHTAKDGEFAHLCERLFGALVYAHGKKIEGLPAKTAFVRLSKAKFRLRNTLAYFFRSVKYRLRLKKYLEVLRATDLFDGVWYSSEYQWDGRKYSSPEEHYLLFGGLHGCDPSLYFSSEGYFELNPDVKFSGFNPLIHYVTHGKTEGRFLSK